MCNQKCWNGGVLGLLLATLLVALWPLTPVLAGGRAESVVLLPSSVVGTGTPESCTEEALDTALSVGGTIAFNCGAAPSTITLRLGKTIAQDTTLDGGGLITLSGPSIMSVFSVNAGVTLALKRLVVANGGSGANGGGIYNAGRVELTNSTLRGNTAVSGGGIYNLGELLISDSTLDGNTAAGHPAVFAYGGGLYNAGTATIRNSTFMHNGVDSAGKGGAIFNAGQLTITNTTLFDTAAFPSGAIHNGGELALVAITLSSSDGVGLVNAGAGVVTLKQSIIAARCVGTITSQGYNLSSDSSCGLSGIGDRNHTNPLLAPLADNGGATQTQALLSGSPALDAIPAPLCAVTTDQRGVARPYGNSCDMGAFEANATTFYVNPTGNDAYECLWADSPCRTIGAAIGKAAAGDRIAIAAGTYSEALTINKNLILTGAGAAATILDGGESSAHVVHIDGGWVNIDGVTIQHANTGNDGGGIINHGQLVLNNSVVTHNFARHGAGI